MRSQTHDSRGQRLRKSDRGVAEDGDDDLSSCEAGFSPELTYHAYHALDGHILGFTLWQLGHSAGAKELSDAQDLADFAAKFLRDLRADDYPYLAEHVEQHVTAFGEDGESEFEFGLGLILDGLKRARGVA